LPNKVQWTFEKKTQSFFFLIVHKKDFSSHNIIWENHLSKHKPKSTKGHKQCALLLWPPRATFWGDCIGSLIVDEVIGFLLAITTEVTGLLSYAFWAIVACVLWIRLDHLKPCVFNVLVWGIIANIGNLSLWTHWYLVEKLMKFLGVWKCQYILKILWYVVKISQADVLFSVSWQYIHQHDICNIGTLENVRCWVRAFPFQGV